MAQDEHPPDTKPGLAKAAALQPPDRLQILNRRTLRKTTLSGNTPQDWPFWFYQLCTRDGWLKVRSPAGFCTSVRPPDVYGVIAGESLTVQAMPHRFFLERLALPPADKQPPLAWSALRPPKCDARPTQ